MLVKQTCPLSCRDVLCIESYLYSGLDSNPEVQLDNLCQDSTVCGEKEDLCILEAIESSAEFYFDKVLS